MTRAWQRSEDGEIALQLKIDELHTIISSLRRHRSRIRRRARHTSPIGNAISHCKRSLRSRSMKAAILSWRRRDPVMDDIEDRVAHDQVVLTGFGRARQLELPRVELLQDGQITIALELRELQAMCQTLNMTLGTMSDSKFRSLIGATQEFAAHLLDELIAIRDAVDPPVPED